MIGAIKVANNFIKSWLGHKSEPYAPVEAVPEGIPKFTEPTLYEYIQNYYARNGYPWEEINIFGIRDESNMDKDVVNDWICIADSKSKIVYRFRGSTDPGVYYTKNLFSRGLEGVAHIAMGHHPKVYMVGLHRGKYQALIQTGAKITVWRDVDKDFKFGDLANAVEKVKSLTEAS